MLNKQVCLWLLCCVLSLHSEASVVLSGTRVIFPSNEKEVTIKLTNEGEKPGLIQVWLDQGERDAAPEKVRVPFILTPPLFRLDPQKGQSLRLLMMQKDSLPKDRERVFWLNVLEVPPKHAPLPDQDSNNYMQMAFKTRIKVFYRPSQFNDAAQIKQAFKQLIWRLVKPKDNRPYIAVKNTSPYYITISHMTVPSVHDVQSKEGVMIAPFDEASIAIAGAERLHGNEEIQFAVINDYGGELVYTSQLSA